MIAHLRLLAVLGAALLASACAARIVGTDFPLPDAKSLRLGETTVAQARARYGAPRNEQAWAGSARAPAGSLAFPFGNWARDGLFRELRYMHISPDAVPATVGVEPSKTLTLWFWNEVLVGWRAHSSFKADSTAFDESKVGAIKRRETTRAELVRALGEPGGMAKTPIAREDGYEVLSWESFEFDRAKNESRLMRLDVLLDPLGIVRDLKYTGAHRPIPAPPAPAMVPVPIYLPPMKKK